MKIIMLEHRHAKVTVAISLWISTLKSSLFTFGLASLLLWCPLSASAQKKPAPGLPNNQPVVPEKDLAKAKALFERGEAFFRLSEYEKAIKEYQESYLISKAPLLLLNIAQCYRYLSQYDNAKHSYEAFIREDPNSLYRKEMEDNIAEMEAILEAKRKEADKTPASVIFTTQTSFQESKRLKPWMVGGGISAIVVGSVMLTFLLVSNNNPKPQTDLGGANLGF
jgi:tetratricopeptide (TPR) repeat protein